MITCYCPEKIKYTGKQLSSLFAYKKFKAQGDSIVAFIGECQVKDHMVDIEDVLNNDFIYSKLMLHFIAEHFPANLELAVTRQRLLISIIKDTLNKKIIYRDGDDIMDTEAGKLSVSIATISPVSSLIHVGLNVCEKTGAPVKTCSLEKLGIKDKRDIEAFATEVMIDYAEEIKSIQKACCKVRGVI